MSGLLEGKLAIVTGGGRGIGRVIVQEFAREGAHVLVWDRNQSAIEETEVTVGSRAMGYKVDVSSALDVRKAFCENFRIWDATILVNNAGVDEDFSLLNPKQSSWEAVFEANLKGSRLVTQQMIRSLVQRRRNGSIIFITSVHTALAFQGGAAYDASKHALVGLMRVLALEYGKYGIRFNAVAPGAICDAGRTASIDEATAKRFASRIPLERLGLAADVAPLVAFLASDKASYITGAEFRVDGGLAIKNALFD